MNSASQPEHVPPERPKEGLRTGRNGAVRDFLDIEEVSAEIRRRVMGKSDFAISHDAPDPSPASAPRRPIWLPATDKLWRENLINEFVIGSLPPSPPTFRGRIGGFLVQTVRRALFWLLPQLETFQRQVAVAAKEQAGALRNLTERISSIHDQIDRLGHRIQEVHAGSATRDEVASLRSEAAKTQDSLATLQQMAERQQAQLTAQTVAAAKRAVSGGSAPHGGKSSYVEFQNVFRGSYEDIKRRFAVHLRRLAPEAHGRVDAPLVDLGCGRGEWLSLLREHKFVAYGVDSDPGMVSLCSHDGLIVEQDDLIEHLAALPDNSRGAVTAFHVIEHLPHAALKHFLRAIFRVLIPGGLLLLETPNPANMFVASNTFHLDPTHQSPLPTELTHFLLESAGFTGVDITPLHPFPESAKLNAPGDRAAEFIDEHFFGPQDYAVVCVKPNL